MLKKHVKTLLLIFVLAVIPFNSALASGVLSQTGSIYSGSPTYDSTSNIYTQKYNTDAVVKHYIIQYDAHGNYITEYSQFPSSYGWEYFTGISYNAGYIWSCYSYDANGNQIGYQHFDATSPSTGCDACQIFNTPGWSQYMGELNNILAAIPPAPDWNNVAGIFRDTIAPQIKSDLQDVLGNAPGLPSEPTANSDLDYGGLNAPNGYNNAPGLDSSGFSSSDIENQAPTITQRDDPTGGFTINNPIDSLPSQDEFEKNIPSDPDNPSPPNPNDPDNVAPTPSDPDNTAPMPNDPDNTAPTPSDPDNPAPAAPTDPDNIAPTPSDPDNEAPIPAGTGGFDTPPIPNDSGTAPLPGDTNDTAPIPAADNSTAPLPGH